MPKVRMLLVLGDIVNGGIGGGTVNINGHGLDTNKEDHRIANFLSTELGLNIVLKNSVTISGCGSKLRDAKWRKTQLIVVKDGVVKEYWQENGQNGGEIRSLVSLRRKELADSEPTRIIIGLQSGDLTEEQMIEAGCKYSCLLEDLPGLLSRLIQLPDAPASKRRQA